LDYSTAASKKWETGNHRLTLEIRSIHLRRKYGRLKVKRKLLEDSHTGILRKGKSNGEAKEKKRPIHRRKKSS